MTFRMRAVRRIGRWIVLLGLLAAPDARAACRVSASGAHSVDTRLRTGPDRLCRMAVSVFAGRSCGGAARWEALLPCDQTKLMTISDRGRVVSILTPVAKQGELNAVRVTWGPNKYAWVTLDKLAGGQPFKKPARLSFEGDALKLVADRTVVIPLETVRQLASVLPD
jgi:hypothetical protein